MPRSINPAVPNRYTRAFRWLPTRFNRILDYGCGDGRFIGWIPQEIPSCEAHGCDVDEMALQKARGTYPKVDFHAIVDNRLPYPDCYFDVVCMLDVLEHVSDECAAIEEVWRVLRHGGTLILSVPHKGLFEWLDPGNLKFRFPWLHKVFHRYIARDMETYQRRFADLSSNLYGDISVAPKMWHRHYSDKKLMALSMPYFYDIQVKHFALLTPVWNMVNGLYVALTGREIRLISKAYNLDQKLELGRFSYNVILKAVRSERSNNPAHGV